MTARGRTGMDEWAAQRIDSSRSCGAVTGDLFPGLFKAVHGLWDQLADTSPGCDDPAVYRGAGPAATQTSRNRRSATTCAPKVAAYCSALQEVGSVWAEPFSRSFHAVGTKERRWRPHGWQPRPLAVPVYVAPSVALCRAPAAISRGSQLCAPSQPHPIPIRRADGCHTRVALIGANLRTRGQRMKRLIIATASALSLAALSLPVASYALASQSAPTYAEHPTCAENAIACTELSQQLSGYTGHDEPSLLFYSNQAGSGNDNLYQLTLPTDPPTRPVQDASGGTFNFQLHPAFWFEIGRAHV